MTIISIDNASFCPGASVAEAVAKRRGCPLVRDDEVFSRAAASSGIPAAELRRLVYGPTRLLDGVRVAAPLRTAELRVAMVRILEQDNLVIHGPLGYLVPAEVTHVLKVALVGDRAYRLARAVAAGTTERRAAQVLRQDDERRGAWADALLGQPPWDAALFDLILPAADQPEAAAVDHILELADAPAVATTEDALAALSELRHAAELQLAFAKQGHDVDIVTAKGAVDIRYKKHTMFPARLRQELVDTALAQPGVETATARPGRRYQEASLYLDVRAELPRKVLLVDDEEAFVKTLSKRLARRDIESSVALGGSEALAKVGEEAPDVMVLDLKMPGVDGLEVLRNVKENNSRTEVIILTAHGSEAEERLAFQLGAFAYLRKPVDIGELTETMRRAYRKMQRNARPDE